VPLITVNRKIDKLYKFAERTQDGVLHSELIGVFYNYTFACGMSIHNATDYGNLITKLASAAESYSVTVLGSTFNAYFANIQDEILKDKGTPYFRALTFDVIAISPAVTP
jgi:hypothetical protein